MCCLHLNWLTLWPAFWKRSEAQVVHKGDDIFNSANENIDDNNRDSNSEKKVDRKLHSWIGTQESCGQNSVAPSNIDRGVKIVDNNNSSNNNHHHCCANCACGGAQVNKRSEQYAINLLAGLERIVNTTSEGTYNALADLKSEQNIANDKTALGYSELLAKMSTTQDVGANQENATAAAAAETTPSTTTVATPAVADSTAPSVADQAKSLSSASCLQARDSLLAPSNKLDHEDQNNNSNNNNNNNNNNSIRQERQQLARAFKIRTANKRHLDFDAQFDLGDIGAAQRTKWSGPFHFIQAADCQFGMIDSYVHKRTEPGWKEEIALCENLVRICNNMQPKPAFLIICGDLIDSLPGSEIGRLQAADFKRIFAKLNTNIPLVCVCGNHDVGDEPTENTVLDYRRTFGDDYFYFTKNDILFIVINSQFYQHRENVTNFALEQDRWLESMLDKCKLFKYSFIFEHIPWFLDDPNEENDYFNIRREVRLTWLEKFRSAGVTKIMCGHYHRNAGGWYDGLELVVTSAIGAQCGDDKSGVRIVKVYENTIEHQYYAMGDIPLNVEL